MALPRWRSSAISRDGVMQSLWTSRGTVCLRSSQAMRQMRSRSPGGAGPLGDPERGTGTEGPVGTGASSFSSSGSCSCFFSSDELVFIPGVPRDSSLGCPEIRRWDEQRFAGIEGMNCGSGVNCGSSLGAGLSPSSDNSVRHWLSPEKSYRFVSPGREITISKGVPFHCFSSSALRIFCTARTSVYPICRAMVCKLGRHWLPGASY